jgi:hypothetical protein
VAAVGGDGCEAGAMNELVCGCDGSMIGGTSIAEVGFSGSAAGDWRNEENYKFYWKYPCGLRRQVKLLVCVVLLTMLLRAVTKWGGHVKIRVMNIFYTAMLLPSHKKNKTK